MTDTINWLTHDDGNKAAAYRVTNNWAKYLGPAALDICRFVGVPENPTRLDEAWQGGMLIADGPCQNVGAD